jgi:hypothetical protein
MRVSVIIAIITSLFTSHLKAQMYVNGDTLYGNEWIDYEKTHLKFTVEEQRIYRINFSDIQDQFPQGIRGDELRLFNYGEEQYIYLSETGPLSPVDYLLFYGEANNGRLDKYLYNKDNTEDQINPHYSFYTDQNPYFLTYSEAPSDYIYQAATLSSNTNLDPEIALNTNSRINISDKYYKRTNTETFIKFSLFDKTEAYGSSFSTSDNFSVNTIAPVESSAFTLVQHYFTHGENPQTYNFELNNSNIYDTDVSDPGLKKDTLLISGTLLENNTLSFQATDTESNSISVSLIELWYKTLPTLVERNSLYFTSNSESDQKFKINCLDNENHILLNLTNNTILFPENNSGFIDFTLANISENEFFLARSSSTSILDSYSIVNFEDYSTDFSELLIIYNELNAIEENGNDIIEEYANYHRTESPNTKTVNTANIEQISDQFAYGIQLHPMGIRNISHLYHHNSQSFKYLLLIGKSLRHSSYRKTEDFNSLYGSILFLPTIGEFSSDNLFASNNQNYRPQFSVGRIGAKKAEEIRDYFEKLKEYETVINQEQSLENKLWTKRVLHLVGGSGEGEENFINSQLNNAGAIITNNLFGAEVKTFRKYYENQIVTESSELIAEEVNNGLAILNVFGHSSSNFTQYGIDDTDRYLNKGKYPLFISGGCYSGTCSNNVPALGERITLIKEKGGIAYMGVSGFGHIGDLGNFMSNFYSQIGGEYYGKSMGEALVGVYNDPSFNRPIILQQLIYQGDPTVHFYYHEKPDYTVGQELEILDNNLTTSLDSFDVKVPIYNLGKNIDTSLIINLSIQYPNQETASLKTDTIQAPAYLSEVSYRLPVLDKQKIVGLNRLLVHVDVFNNIEEQTNGGESNNKLVSSDNLEGYPVLFLSNDLKPVLPFNFHQKTNQEFNLYSSTSNFSDLEYNFLLEIDTSILFDSPSKTLLQQNAIGGLVEWSSLPSFDLNNVYYWRTAISSQNTSEISWNNSSFVVSDSDSEGWNQSHYQQFEQDTFINLEIDNRVLSFKDDPVNFNIINIIRQGGVRPVVNSDIGRYFMYLGTGSTSGVGFVILDPFNLQCIDGLENNGQESIYAYPWAIGEGHIFNTSTPSQRKEVVDFINNVIPENAYVAFLTLQNDPNQDFKPEEWAADSLVYNTNIFQALESKGANIIRNLENTGSVPYGYIYQEGNPDFETNESISSNPLDYDYTSALLEGSFNQGYLKSQHIGPVSAWGRLKYELSDVESNDTISIELYGIDHSGNFILLQEFTESSLDTDISQLIDATDYPELFLTYNIHDPVNSTVPNLEYWTVEYEGAPEACVAPNILFELQDTIYQGELLNLKLAAKNISVYDMDSLLVKTTFIDGTGFSEVLLKRYAPISAQNILSIESNYETKNLKGLTKMIIEINPEEDQIEVSTINNVFSTEVMIIEDRIDPLLSVRFDGKRILDGDLVSPSPRISISIKDDNPNLLLNDTSLFEIKIKYLTSSDIRSVYFNEPGVIFEPAEDATNTATIEFERDFEEDGIYTLYVAAKDVSGNSLSNLSESPNSISAGLDYKIDFEVINKSMISNFYNYPNPFSTATRFVYTLTGDKMPTYFKIQILTASGKIVREISQAEFGPLMPGVNQSEFVWDGRDQFGDQLANGVYLYKIIAKDENGDNFEKYDLNDAESQHFLNGFGKMVLIR